VCARACVCMCVCVCVCVCVFSRACVFACPIVNSLLAGGLHPELTVKVLAVSFIFFSSGLTLPNEVSASFIQNPPMLLLPLLAGAGSQQGTIYCCNDPAHSTNTFGEGVCLVTEL
jgi:hypothetical protein